MLASIDEEELITSIHTEHSEFQLLSVVANRMRSGEAAIFFSSNLLHVARDFIKKKPWSAFFCHAHSRRKDFKISKNYQRYDCGKGVYLKFNSACSKHTNVSTALVPVFLASDFAEYGTCSSRRARQAREKFTSLSNF